MYKRTCKNCGNDVFHKNQQTLDRAIKQNKECVSCAQKKCKIGNANGMFGKKHSIKTKEKIKEKRKEQIISEESIAKMAITQKRRLEQYNHWLGRRHSDDSKNKMRLVAANRINDNKWHPSFNITACEIIEKYGNENGYMFRHAMNGGEFFIKELGYWVDGYDENKNVVIEYYEKHHLYSTNEDDIRIEKIKNHLNCKIVILKEWEM